MGNTATRTQVAAPAIRPAIQAPPLPSAALPRVEVGGNAVLVGGPANSARQQGLYEVVQIMGAPTPGQVQIKLFRPRQAGDPPVREGGVGIPSSTAIVPASALRVLAYVSTPPVSDDRLQDNVRALACRNLDRTNIWGCRSCDPTGKQFDAGEFSDSVTNVLAAITSTREGGSGSVYYHMFMCPSDIIRAGEAIAQPDPACSQPIIASVRRQDGTNRYNLVAVPDDLLLQEAFLFTYNMPVEEQYFAALPWSSIPQYQRLRSAMLGMRIVCDTVDNVWLAAAVDGLLRRGFEYEHDIGITSALATTPEVASAIAAAQ